MKSLFRINIFYIAVIFSLVAAGGRTLTGKDKAAKTNPKITALQVELAHVGSEIEKLVGSLTGRTTSFSPM